jgi:hypothetical protein
MSARFVRTTRRHVQVTARDLAIVEAVFEARYLTNRQIGQLFFSAGAFSSCKKRLRYLFDLGYLKKRAAYPNEPDIYFLGLKGKRHIAGLGQYPPHDIDLIAGVAGDKAAAPALMMRHELTLAQLYVNATLECQRYGWKLRWENARMLEMRKLGVQPDAFLQVEGRKAFLEFTAVLPGGQELHDKLRGYTPLLEALEGQALVLWMTTSAAKLGQLRRALRHSPYPDYFLLGLIEESGSFLTRPMWSWSEKESQVAFIAAPPRVLYEVGGQAHAGLPSEG